MEGIVFPFDTTFDQLKPYINTVMLNIISLQADLLAEADLIDLDAFILNSISVLKT